MRKCISFDNSGRAGEASAGGAQAPLALLSWGHSDGVVRLKRRRDEPPQPLLHVPRLDQVATLPRRGWKFPGILELTRASLAR